MARYIDADELMKELGITDPDCERCGWGRNGFSYCTREGDFVYACDAICEAPTADVVDVVRCKECKHSVEDKLFGGLWCQHPTEKRCERNADFYCGSGERRTDDDRA